MKLWLCIIPIVCLIFLCVTVISYMGHKKDVDLYIRNSFGDKSRSNSDIFNRLEVIVKLFDLDSCEYKHGDIVDDITWHDLDMDLVFQRINHTDSYAGEQVLYSKLHILDDTYCSSILNAESIEYFHTHTEERNKVRKILHQIGKSYTNYCTLDIITHIHQLHLPFRYAYPLLGASMITLCLAGVVLWNRYIVIAFIANYIISMILYMIIKEKFEHNMNAMSCVRSTICAGDAIRQIVSNSSKYVDTDILSLRKVVRLLNILNFSNSINKSDGGSLVFSYIGGPTMLDFIAYEISITLLSHKQKEFMSVYRYIGGIDSSIAIASYRQSIDNCCVSVVSEDSTIKFADLYHPLLDSPVPNSIVLRKNAIFTGSNASGKSTFIKAVAVNLILGQTIYTCTADHAVIPKCNVLTSMAVCDDLSSGESYYIKEVKYLKRMVDIAHSDKLSFFAIDEILKGTNTKERLAASKAVLKYFGTKNCIFAVATHDVELAEYFNNECSNYFFCETYDSSGIIFDYRLKKGVCHTSNALTLLEVMDYPTDIVDAAKIFIE